MQETAATEATATADADLQPIPGLDALGFGYDVRGEYASAYSIKLPIIDVGPATNQQQVNGQTYLVPDNITVNAHTMDTNNYSLVTGHTISSYRSSLNTTTKLEGDYRFFSGSLQVDFDMEETENSEYEFSTVRNVIDLWSLNLPDVATLNLIPSAAADINGSMPAADVLNKYGSHFIWQGVIGGRADYSSSTDKMTFDQSYDLGLTAQMSYENAVGSISASNQSEYSSEISQFNSNSNIEIRTIGGNPTLGGDNITKGGFNDWVSSILNLPVLIDFTSNSLVPIWELCTDPNRAQELQDAYVNYMTASSQSIDTDDPILEVKFTDNLIFAGSDHDSHADDSVSVYRPAFSGDYYWVGQYAQGDHNQPDGTTIIVKSLTKGALAAPIDYEKVWDNHGGKGNYCYSCWRPVPPVGYVALGYIMRLWVKNQDKPSGSEVDGLMCVHESLVVKSQAENTDIWNDHGTNADENCSIYNIIPDPNNLEPDNQTTTGVNAGTYYGQQHSASHAPNPTSPQVYCLDRNKVTIDNPGEEPK